MSQLPQKPAAKIKTWMIVVLVIILFPVVVFGGAYFATKAPSDASQAFIQALSSDPATAYTEMTSADFKAATSEEAYDAFLDSNSFLTNVSDTTFNNRAVENGVATISGTLTATDGTTSPITLTLVQEDGEWKVYNLSLEPPPTATQ